MQSSFNGNHRLNHFMRQTSIRKHFVATLFDACASFANYVSWFEMFTCNGRPLIMAHTMAKCTWSKRNQKKQKINRKKKNSDAAIFFFIFFVVIYYS